MSIAYDAAPMADHKRLEHLELPHGSPPRAAARAELGPRHLDPPAPRLWLLLYRPLLSSTIPPSTGGRSLVADKAVETAAANDTECECTDVVAGKRGRGNMCHPGLNHAGARSLPGIGLDGQHPCTAARFTDSAAHREPVMQAVMSPRLPGTSARAPVARPAGHSCPGAGWKRCVALASRAEEQAGSAAALAPSTAVQYFAASCTPPSTSCLLAGWQGLAAGCRPPPPHPGRHLG